MEKNYLIEVEKKFYSTINEITDVREKFSRFEKYYNWIKSIECPKDVKDEISNTCLRMEGKCIDQLIKWLTKTNTRSKDLTSNWNGLLVKRVANYVEWYEKNVKTNLEPNSISKSAVVMKAVWDEKDFATKAYCWQLLQRADLKYNTFGSPSEKEVVLAETEFTE